KRQRNNVRRTVRSPRRSSIGAPESQRDFQLKRRRTDRFAAHSSIMWIINTALRRPFTILVIVVGVALRSVLAITRMPVDIFPNLNLPVIYVAQPYGGMDPAQMESFLTSYYEYHFLYVSGIEHVESRSIQNVALLKLYFHPGTDMSQALAQVIAYVER